MPGGILGTLAGFFGGGKRYPTYQEWFADYANWHVVTSSNVSSVSFYESQASVSGNILGIRYKSGHEYHYYGLTKGQFQSLLNAPSKGRWVDQHLKKARVPFRGPL